jgi:SM-20-related protein
MLNPSDVDQLAQHGWLVSTSLLAAPLIDALAADCAGLNQHAALRPAAVGRGGRKQQDSTLRGDAIRWIEPDPEVPVRGDFLTALDALRGQLNRSLMLGLASVEAHYAVYPPGARYVRHRDRFRDDDARTISFTAYLNRQWTGEDGGALRLHLAEGVHDVLPHLGTCTLFLSADIEHEVLPARRERMSIAGWFRRRPSQVLGTD